MFFQQIYEEGLAQGSYSDEGGEFRVGNIRIKAVHTPEHPSFLVASGAVTEEPRLFLTGGIRAWAQAGYPLERSPQPENASG